MANRLQIRRGTAAAATSTNPLLGDGEWGVETDTRKVKMGDGVTLWNALDYLAVEFNWLGELATAPVSPAILDCYKDTTLGEVRIYNGATWDTMAEDGADGADGGPIPSGGAVGQILVKQSTTDGDVAYENPPSSDPFIVGDILMHDGTWVDNVTRVGWYACIAANSGQGCPDLEDTFIKGSAPADVGTTGGSNTHTLGATEIPSHTHSIAHDHGSASTGGHHHHQGNPMLGTSSAYGYETSTTLNSVNYNFGATNRYPETSVTTPSINLPAYAGDSDGGTGGGLAHNNEPQYYKLIYIRKCA